MRRFQGNRCFESVLLLGILLGQRLLGQPAHVEIVFPREDATVVTRDSAFIYGYYNPQSLRIQVNGIAARQFDGNRFLAFVPTTPGHFTFSVEAFLDTDSSRLLATVSERHVYIPHYLVTSPPAPLLIDTSLIYPHSDLALRPGDMLGLAFKGSPGAKAYCIIEGITRLVSMKEESGNARGLWREEVFGKSLPLPLPEVAGIYTATLRIPENHSLHNARVHYVLHGEAGEQVQRLAAGRLTVVQAPENGRLRLTSDLVFGRKFGRRQGELVTLPAGSRLPFLGSDGGDHATEVNGLGKVWIPSTNAEVLRDGSEIPNGSIHAISADTTPFHTQIRIALDSRLPFRVRQSTDPPTLDVLIHGVRQFPAIDETELHQQAIRKLRVSRDGDDTVHLQLRLKQKRWWGFLTQFEGNDLIISIRKPPALADSALRELLVCLDPGHGPDPGAIGAAGTNEREWNLLIASALQEELHARGAHVIITRSGESGVALDARRLFAEASQADVFISIHHNSLPEGMNPLSRRGTGVYYFLPQSQELAEIIFRNLHQTTNLPKFGLFHNNFVVCRTTSMPAILLETAFLTHPEDESLIMDATVRQHVVAAIVLGLEEYFRNALQEE